MSTATAPTPGAIADRMTRILGRVDPLSLSGADMASVRRLAAASDAVFEAAIGAALKARTAGQDAPGATNGLPGDSQAVPSDATLSEPLGA